MRLSRVITASLSPALLLICFAAATQAQVDISEHDHILHFRSLSLQSKSNSQPALPPQMSYNFSTFTVGEDTDLNDYRSPDDKHPLYGSKLHRQKGIGRLLLFTTCTPDCQYEVWLNNSADRGQDDWKRAATADRLGLTLLSAMFDNNNLEFAINGVRIHPTGGDMHLGNSSISHYYIQVFESNDPCRRYKAVYGPDALRDTDDNDTVSINLLWKRRWPQTANGIVVGAPKVYDTFALTTLRNEALRQLQTINPFVASSITGAYGNLQGVTRDQSYLNVQGQFGTPASPAPSVTDQTATCPPGYYPAGVSACSPIPTGATGTAPLTALATSQTVTPTTLTPSIPPAPTYNNVPTPGPVGQSSSDALVEQVQLSAQLQVYQLLLTGAQSDTLLVQNARAVAARAQTTVSFPISIDPPRQFRHAVAEVRVLIEPYPTATSGLTQPVSIVNLLPSQKTYNVAKITNKQRSFGGAAVIEQIASAGVSGGKTKDRLYLAKDTDTVALQYDHPSVKPLRSPFPEQALTGLEVAVRMQRLDECDNEWFAIDQAEDRGDLDSKTSRDNSVMFGWQFRPVLGADYVSSGPRQVFAQLALPEALGDESFLPAVLVQTRWREYDERRQVVGPVFHSSCTVTPIKDPVIIANPLRVNDTTWDDIGNGTLKIRAHGSFFSPGVTLQSGKNAYPPVTFDGHDIQFFAPAKDLLMNGELNLVGENNQVTSLTIPLADRHTGCEIDNSSLWAIPRSDGTASVSLVLWPGQHFGDELPNSRPLVLIGSDVYGLKDKPFQKAKHCDTKGERVCLYEFTADADNLRAASNYYVRDLSWSNSNLPGSIRFAPFMAKLSKFYEDPKKTAKLSQTTYRVSGSELKYLRGEQPLKLKAYSVNTPQGIKLPPESLVIVSDSEALLTLPYAPKGKTVTISWMPSHWPLTRDAPITWELALPDKESPPDAKPSPSFLAVGDSRTVTYTGVDFSTVQSVSFDKTTPLTFKKSPDDPKSMDVFVPSSVTKEPGHKELIAVTKDKKGKTDQIVLPVDVSKH